MRFGDRDTSHERRFEIAFKWATAFFSDFQPDVWSYETPQAGSFNRGKSNIDTQLLLNGLPAVVGLAAQQARVKRMFRCDVGDIRHHFLGRRNLAGKIAKRQTIEKCRAFGWDVKNDNEGDACAGWSFMCSLLVPELGARVMPLFGGPQETAA